MLLRVYILARNVQILVILEPDTHGLSHLVCHLASTQHGASTLANTNGIARAIGIQTKHLSALHQQLAVGYQTRADIDDIDAVNNLFGARDSLEIFALGNHRTRHSGIILIGYSPHQRIASHNRNTQSSHTVGLHRETSLARHGLNNGLDSSPSLHALIGGEVADVAGAYRQHSLT